MDRLLRQYRVSVEDVNLCDKDAIAAFERGETSEAHMERLVRFVATNRQIQHYGLAELPLLPTDARKKSAVARDGRSYLSVLLDRKEEEPAQEQPEQEWPDECREIGLTAREYSYLKGDYGTVLGIAVNKAAYKALLRKCRSKGALSLQHNEARTRTFMIKKMKHLAASHMHRRQRRAIMAGIRAKAKKFNKSCLGLYHSS